MKENNIDYKILSSYHSDPHAAIAKLTEMTLSAIKNGYKLQGAPFVFNGMVYQSIIKYTEEDVIAEEKARPNEGSINTSIASLPKTELLDRSNSMSSTKIDMAAKGKKK